MNNKAMVFNEKTVGRHTRRLQKELSKLNHELKLSEVQNMLSRILGMNNYHELKQVLKFENESNLISIKKTNFEKYEDTSKEYYNLETNHFEKIDHDKFYESFNPLNGINFEKKFKNDFPEISTNEMFAFFNKNENLNYLLDNIYLILSYACLNDKIDLFKLITKFINFKYLPSDQLELIIYWLLVLSDKSIKIFDYLFFNLKLPENLKFEEVGKITYFLISTGNINLLDKFLKDDRVSFQKHFYWGLSFSLNKDDNDFLGHAGQNSNLEMVKYLVTNHALTPVNSGRTILKSCYSGNLKIIKYLINDLNANYSFIEENKSVEFGAFSTLTAAVTSRNLNLVRYLIEDKKLNVSEYDFIAIKKAFSICSLDIIKYFLNFPNVQEYIQKDIINLLKITIEQKYDQNNSKLKLNEFNRIQFNIVYYIFEKYNIQENYVIKNINKENDLLFNFIHKNLS